ncbi:hypothetical protein FJQ98_14030 [Lysinibacillus agricola]|uniref:DUF4352 domain-containing protein n=1 Tax=Lysinibacillus agricola TaxID=2590012 RepID=A0ABX7ALT0_9BACI|nr:MULTISPECIES: hypothetical protein [Lysinibacillus]QQP10406.1 hypothetical protein FJQ98_14030 [Lysinibacillus agricola]
MIENIEFLFRKLLNEKIITLIISILNILIAYRVYRFTKKDVNPKLSVKSTFEDSENEYSKSVNKELLEINFETRGFPKIQHNTKLWKLTIENNGELPATNVVLDYSITIKKGDFDFGIDEADILNKRFIDYKTINRTEKFDYIAPDSKKVLKVLYIQGEFPCADLKVKKLKSDEITFIKKEIKIDTYEHPEFSMIVDGPHERKLFGI